MLVARVDENGKFNGEFDQETDDPYIVFPNGAYANAEEFYGDWQQAEIPFFPDF